MQKAWCLVLEKVGGKNIRCFELPIIPYRKEIGKLFRRSSLNAERVKRKEQKASSQDVSVWYLAGKLGARYLRGATAKLGPLQAIDTGVWRGTILERSIYLVSSADLSVEFDSMPLHVLGVEPGEKELAAARLIVQQPALWELYSEFFGTLHPAILKEMQAMARASKKAPQFHLKPLVDLMGMTEAIDQLGVDRVVDDLMSNPKRMEQTFARILSRLSEEQRAKLQRRLQSRGE